MTKPTTFGANLKAARERADLTQEELAERLGFKRTTAISLWERSPHLPEPATIIKLAKAIGCPAADLMRDVITPYDKIRGMVVVAEGDIEADAIEGLSVLDAKWLEVGRRLPDAVRRKHLTLILATLDELHGAAPRSRSESRRMRTGSPRVSSGQDRTPREHRPAR